MLRSYTDVAHLEAKEQKIASLPPDSPIPDYLHTAVDIPFKRPYAYKVVVSGRSVAGRIGAGGEKVGGRFARDEFNIPTDRPLTIREIEAIAARRFGAGGKYPLISINRVSVVAAMTR